MCNPRKIVERATRKISEAWREVIERTAQLHEAHVVGRRQRQVPRHGH